MERIIREVFSIFERFSIVLDESDKMELEFLIKRILSKKKFE